MILVNMKDSWDLGRSALRPKIYPTLRFAEPGTRRSSAFTQIDCPGDRHCGLGLLYESRVALSSVLATGPRLCSCHGFKFVRLEPSDWSCNCYCSSCPDSYYFAFDPCFHQCTRVAELFATRAKFTLMERSGDVTKLRKSLRRRRLRTTAAT